MRMTVGSSIGQNGTKSDLPVREEFKVKIHILVRRTTGAYRSAKRL